MGLELGWMDRRRDRSIENGQIEDGTDGFKVDGLKTGLIED